MSDLKIENVSSVGGEPFEGVIAFNDINLNADVSCDHDIVTISFLFKRDRRYADQRVNLKLDREEFKKALGL